MKKLKIYLDTNIIGFLDEPTSPREMTETLALWELIRKNEFEVVVSKVALDEIDDNKNQTKVNTQKTFLSEINFETMEVTNEIHHISDLIKKMGLLTSKKHLNDRLHIGCAMTYGADLLISWNYKDLVNQRTIDGVKRVAISEGYGYIDIVTPRKLLKILGVVI